MLKSWLGWKKKALVKKKSLTVFVTGSLAVNVTGVNQSQLFIGKMGLQQLFQKVNSPLVLPVTKDIRPSGTGESPLANLTDWLEVTREDGVKGRRETNTMPQWAGSSWYYLRYIDPHNTEKLADEDLLKQWLPVDIYVGGAEHAVLHLLYARFWHKFLYDLGVVPTKEPFQKLFNQGMILGTSYRDHRGALVATDKVEKRDGSFFHVETGEELEQAPAKMSKSLKNVVNPDDVVEQYGADTLRVYEMFMGPLDASIAWSEEGSGRKP